MCGNSDIAHSLSNQVTYIKKIDTTTGINTKAITKLSNIVKDTVIQSHDRFQQMWINITLDSRSELYMTIRQLDFALLSSFNKLTSYLELYSILYVCHPRCVCEPYIGGT